MGGAICPMQSITLPCCSGVSPRRAARESLSSCSEVLYKNLFGETWGGLQRERAVVEGSGQQTALNADGRAVVAFLAYAHKRKLKAEYDADPDMDLRPRIRAAHAEIYNEYIEPSLPDDEDARRKLLLVQP